MKSWQQTKGAPVWYPELQEAEIRPKRLENFVASDLRYGVAFSGGGTRSASATLGQIRALEDLGWMKRIHYSSSISGGSWTAIPYSFIPDQARNHIVGNEEFLGHYIPPAEITRTNLEDTNRNGMQAASIAKSGIPLLAAWASLQGDESYSWALNRIFLKNPGLGESRFFSYDGTGNGLIVPSGQLTGHNSHIYAANPGKPYPIVSGTVDDRRCSRHDKKERIYTLEMTPHYVGTPAFWTGAADREYGGQYLASLGYDSKYQRLNDDGTLTVRWHRRGSRFTISDMMAISGAAPSSTFYDLPLLKDFGLPEMKHGHPHSYSPGVTEIAKGFPHGDGGNLEGLAVRPLLARGANRIIAFVNTPRPLGDVHYLDRNEVDKLTPLSAMEIMKGIKYVNGEWPKATCGRPEKAKTLLDGDLVGMFMPLVDEKGESTGAPRPVFRNGAAKLEALYAELVRCKKAGEPLIHCDTYILDKDERYGIQAGGKVKICWVYLDGATQWIEKIQEGKFKHRLTTHPFVSPLVSRRLRRFPNYATFAEQRGILATGTILPLQLIDLSVEQANALAQFSGWVVRKRSHKIADHLNLN